MTNQITKDVWKVKILDSQDKIVWDKFLDFSPLGNFYQTWNWGEIQKKMGLKVLRVGVIKNTNLVLTAQITLRKNKLLGNFASLKFGPVIQNLQEIDKSLEQLLLFFTTQSRIYDFAGLEVIPLFETQISETLENSLVVTDSRSVVKTNSKEILSSLDLALAFQRNKFIFSQKDTFSILLLDLTSEISKLLNTQPKNTRKFLKYNLTKKYKYLDVWLGRKLKFKEIWSKTSNYFDLEIQKAVTYFDSFADKEITISVLYNSAKQAYPAVILSHNTNNLTTVLGLYFEKNLELKDKLNFIWSFLEKSKFRSNQVIFTNNTSFIAEHFNVQSIFSQTLVLQLNPLKYTFLDSGKLISKQNFQSFVKNTRQYISLISDQAKFWLKIFQQKTLKLAFSMKNKTTKLVISWKQKIKNRGK